MKIAIDVGATTTRIGFFDERSKLFAKKKFRTSPLYKDAIKIIFQKIEQRVSRRKIRGIALVVPGLINRQKGEIVFTDHLPDWSNKKIAEAFEKKFDVQTVLENDAASAALGEALLGAGKGKEIVAYLTLSTGVGGARVVNGRLDQSATGFEPGHQIIVPNGRYWKSCQQKGCLEAYVSGTAFYEIYRVKPEDCNDKKIWKDWSRHLAHGLVNIIVIWSPHIIVLGGGLANKGGLFLEHLRKFTKDNLPFMSIPEIELSTLSDDAGLFGGLSLLSS